MASTSVCSSTILPATTTTIARRGKKVYKPMNMAPPNGTKAVTTATFSKPVPRKEVRKDEPHVDNNVPVSDETLPDLECSPTESTKEEWSPSPGEYSPPPYTGCAAIDVSSVEDKLVFMSMGKKGVCFKSISYYSGAKYIWYNTDAKLIEVWGSTHAQANAIARIRARLVRMRNIVEENERIAERYAINKSLAPRPVRKDAIAGKGAWSKKLV
jgi:hypothetical protein